MKWWLALIPVVAMAMSMEEKVGLLFVVSVSPTRGEDHFQDWDRLIEECHISNVLPKSSDFASYAKALARLQRKSKQPLLVLADAEWGLGMRITDALSFPKNGLLGAIQDLSLLKELGREIGREAVAAGIDINLAPVVDVNSNPNNPIIGLRSFGDKPEIVSPRAVAVMTGMQEMELRACAKHFPGHGDTAVDSHVGLPVVDHPLDAVELPPFQAQIDAGVTAIMTAHILVPALDPTWPATLSPSILTKLLREKMGFQGLIITDALNMNALADRYSPEEIALRAHEAGADLLLYGDHLSEGVDHLLRDQVPRAYRALLKAYQNGLFPLSRLDASVNRILPLKRAKEAPTLHIFPEALELKEQLAELSKEKAKG
ncbi:MAG: hypothetical protein KGJ02_06010 [Verrucomicrobiota bacterium]|nr:hypothetical protein [Verrucomicrobiota bacterium]